ncbi:hypothetical protein B0H14DRAFT_3125868 [Mycena olivaceomarginata]|nr:hypothetical protein B0H14DRAFT_3125868 [Mycena olivaceomarginata]
MGRPPKAPPASWPVGSICPAVYPLEISTTALPQVEVPGGFYLTDSVMVAAQFACYGSAKRPATVEILQYRWNPASFSVYDFPGETADWKNFQTYNSSPNLVVNLNSPYRPLARTIYTNSMITGPLAGPADVFITNAAWQYAMVNQNAANTLALQAQHPGILCKNVPHGNRVDANLYAQGQAGNAKFNTRLAHLKDPNYSPGNGQFKYEAAFLSHISQPEPVDVASVKLHDFENAIEDYTAAMFWSLSYLRRAPIVREVLVPGVQLVSELQLTAVAVIAGLIFSAGLLVMAPVLAGFKSERRDNKSVDDLGVLEILWLAGAGAEISAVDEPDSEHLRKVGMSVEALPRWRHQSVDKESE